MSDRSILFKPPMIRALLDGRKTQTRRVVKPQPSDVDSSGRWYRMPSGGLSLNCHDLPYASGDRLWVREAWWAEGRYDDFAPREIPRRAPIYYQTEPEPGCAGRYRHARFMPRWASRLTLTVTDVRVQRLQEISEADAIAEGVRRFGPDWTVEKNDGHGAGSKTAAGCFRLLWNSIHGPDAWDTNPWVVALTFEVHCCNIDQMGDQQ